MVASLQTTTDILESIYDAIKAFPAGLDPAIPFYASYPETGESMGLEHMAGEQIGSMDMLGNTERTLTYEITYKTQANGISVLNQFATYIASAFDELVSANDSYEINDKPTVTLPIYQGSDDNWNYFSIDINVNIITPY
ncbi:hypothetical protein [Lactiplantibacillus fabifermentans]|uniref:Uncharacterized protein n=1 Tax=Lactiplantibacillus fabifermentans DSM 21115 TaxID=1413187 RepID=A0A0R2NRX7_9LACO|nr:hypothetical protein [Lactiplantibacillus fabifermentans]KRO28465.1 hypothetical protein DY78_GL002364 [Lactiplantibacillus fabifermentans DSM 21115]